MDFNSVFKQKLQEELGNQLTVGEDIEQIFSEWFHKKVQEGSTLLKVKDITTQPQQVPPNKQGGGSVLEQAGAPQIPENAPGMEAG